MKHHWFLPILAFQGDIHTSSKIVYWALEGMFSKLQYVDHIYIYDKKISKRLL